MANLLDLQREFMEREGTAFASDDVLVKSTTRMEMLVFKKNPSKPGLISEYDRIKVFPDNGYGGLEIQEGEVYICILNKYENGGVYYARAIRKVDVNILMECDQNLKNEMISVLWKRNRAQFEKGFEEKYLGELQTRIEEELRERHQTELRAREDANAALREEIRILKNDLASRPERSEIGLGSEEIVLTSVEAEAARPPRAVAAVPAAPTIGTVRRDPMETGVDIREYTVVIQGGRLSCDALRNGRYHVHMSPDMRTMLIRPSEEGTIYAYDSGMSIDRLGEIYGSSDPLERNYLKAEYSERYGGMLVHLRCPPPCGFFMWILRFDVDFSHGFPTSV